MLKNHFTQNGYNGRRLHQLSRCDIDLIRVINCTLSDDSLIATNVKRYNFEGILRTETYGLVRLLQGAKVVSKSSKRLAGQSLLKFWVIGVW